MIWDYLTLLQEIRWQDLFDIALAAVFIWFGVHALRTMRTYKVGLGLFAFLLMILLANQSGLKLTVWILQGISAVIILSPSVCPGPNGTFFRFGPTIS